MYTVSANVGTEQGNNFSAYLRLKMEAQHVHIDYKYPDNGN